MALYHLSAKTGTRASGQSALAKAQYIQREDRYARVPDRVLYASSGNLPSFAAEDPAAYWDAADLYERANGRLFKEIEFALPLELYPEEHQALAEAFVQDLLAGEKLPYTIAIHEGRGRNPHCHVLVSERVNDGVDRPARQWFRRWNPSEPERGGARKTEALKPREWLERIREKWAELVNRALERAGLLERVDHRSLAAQGIERVPQLHLGPNVIRMENRGLRTDRGDQSIRIARGNDEIVDRRAEIDRLERAKSADPEIELEPPQAPAEGRPAAHTTRPGTEENEGPDRSRSPSEEPAHEERREAPAPSTGRDRTARAVERQLRAMGCATVEIGLRNIKTGRMRQLSGPADRILEILPQLKGLNANGDDIFIRPAEKLRHGLVLVDDLSKSALRQMERDHRTPALVVETSPGNHQAWVKVPDRASAAERTEIARRLAREYGGDPASASSRHYGRLAGFTNQKECHRTPEGRQPFALVRGASGKAASAGELLLRQATRALHEKVRAAERSWSERAPTRPDTPEQRQSATEAYRARFNELHRHDPNPSRCDFGAARHLAEERYDRPLMWPVMANAPPLVTKRDPLLGGRRLCWRLAG